MRARKRPGRWGDFDDGYPAEHFAGVAALVAGVAGAFDQAFGFVEVERGDGDPTAPGDFADGEGARNGGDLRGAHRLSLYLKFT